MRIRSPPRSARVRSPTHPPTHPAHRCLFFFRRQRDGGITIITDGCSGRELHGDNALQYVRRVGTAAAFAAGLREHAGAVQPRGARLEGRHAARHAIRQAQRAGHAAGDGHPHVRATGRGNTRRAARRRTQLTTVSRIYRDNTVCANARYLLVDSKFYFSVLFFN